MTKKQSTSVIALILALCILTACNKNGEPNAAYGEIALSKLKIKINEPDSMLFVGADTTKAVTWVVTPAGSDELLPVKTVALIKFTKAGTYTIKANNSDIESKPKTITVIDSVYVPTLFYAKLADDDQISLVPQIIKSAKSDSSYLAFTVTTKDKYCSNSVLDFGIGYESMPRGFYMSVQGTYLHPNGCSPVRRQLSAHNDFSSFLEPLTVGTYRLFISLHDINTQGSVEVTPTQVIFHWDDASGVILSPKVLAR